MKKCILYRVRVEQYKGVIRNGPVLRESDVYDIMCVFSELEPSCHVTHTVSTDDTVENAVW